MRPALRPSLPVCGQLRGPEQPPVFRGVPVVRCAGELEERSSFPPFVWWVAPSVNYWVGRFLGVGDWGGKPVRIVASVIGMDKPALLVEK